MTDDLFSRRLSELFDLYKSGALSEEEYESLKSDIINQGDTEQEPEEKKSVESKPSREEVQSGSSIGSEHHVVENNGKSPGRRGVIAFFSALLLVIVTLAIIFFRPEEGLAGAGRRNNHKETMVKDIEGNIYNTVTIGTQTWMTENLRSTKYNDGSEITLVTDSALWAKLTTPAFCWYNNDEDANKESFGALYNWYSVETGKLCPAGWHVPTNEEWNVLEAYLIDNGFGYEGSGNDIAKSIAAASGWIPDDTAGNVGNGQSSNNRSGFNASQGGYRFSYGSFLYKGSYGKWWSSTESSRTSAYIRFIFSESSVVNSYANQKRNGFSVRCIKDTDMPESPLAANSVQVPVAETVVWDSIYAVKSIMDELKRHTDWPFNESFTSEELKHEFYDFIEIDLEGKELKIGIAYTTLEGHCPPYCDPLLSVFEFENKAGWRLNRKAFGFHLLSPQGKIEFYRISSQEYGMLVKNRFSSGKWGTSNSINLFAFVDDNLRQTLAWYREDLDTVFSAKVLKTVKDGQSYVMIEEKAKPDEGDTIITQTVYRFDDGEYKVFTGYMTDPSLTSISRFYDIDSFRERQKNICPTCHGTGIQVCNLCGGTGVDNMGIECGCIRTYKMEIVAGHTPSHPPLRWTCPACGGTGEYHR